MQKIFERIFCNIFKNFQPKFVDFGQKTADFNKIFAKLKKKKKKKNSQNGNFGSVAPVK